MTMTGSLDRGRASFGRQVWADAYAQLISADRETALELTTAGAVLAGADADLTVF